jgi:hypothetical protein
MSTTDSPDVFSYITTEENAWRTQRIPLTNSKDWSMYEHIQRCTNVANAWYHKGANDGTRPYDDLVTPIIDVAFRSEGFDVKDIVPFVNQAKEYHKSFLVKKYHPQWARKNELDTFIDEVVETSIIYDLVLIKKGIKKVRPEVVDLKTLAFCDQTDIMAGPICIKHNFTPAELVEYKGKWNSTKIDIVIAQAKNEKKVTTAEDQPAKTPGKYIEVYELRGNLPALWNDKDKGAVDGTYTPQMHIVVFSVDSTGAKNGVSLYSGTDNPLSDNFKALKIDQVRSKGRACGRSVVERLFEPQVWNNYSAIKIKEMLDSAVDVLISDSEELGNQRLNDLPKNTILKQERGASTTRLNGDIQNLTAFTNQQIKQENNARILGSASEGSLGQNPTSGTPFALQALIVQEGQGIHDYRQGKIATFFADELYRDWFLDDLVGDMNAGKTFSEELTLDEMQEIADRIIENQVEQEIKALILDDKIPPPEIRDELMQLKKAEFMKGGSRRFFEILKGELDELPMDVFVNIKGKQRRMAENADKITNVIRQIIANPTAFQQVPGLGKVFNELLEESGMSPIDFSQITSSPVAAPPPAEEALPVTQ